MSTGMVSKVVPNACGRLLHQAMQIVLEHGIVFCDELRDSGQGLEQVHQDGGQPQDHLRAARAAIGA